MTKQKTTINPGPLANLIVPDGWEAEEVLIFACADKDQYCIHISNDVGLFEGPIKDTPSAAVAAANEALVALAKSVMAKVEGEPEQ